MRGFRSSIVVVLLLGAALAVTPAALSASQSSWGRQAAPALGVLDQAWQLVGRLAGWFGGSRVDEGATPDPNGKANPAHRARAHSRADRPAPGVRPDAGASPDPNGGPAPSHG